jgi:hypothetical protein
MLYDIDYLVRNSESTQKEETFSMATDPKRDFLRHTLATLAYRGGKAIRNAPSGFADFRGAGRSPVQILAHVGDLLDWSLSMARGERKYVESQTLPWDEEVGRFFSALRRFDDYLASTDAVHVPVEKLFQGPIADALTHVGQIAMLRRMAGVPISGENYFVADMAVGRVGSEQAVPKKEF